MDMTHWTRDVFPLASPYSRRGITAMPLWAKNLLVAVLGFLAFVLMEVSEFARQEYELAVCANSADQCLFGSANSALIAQASAAVGAMALAALLANALAPPALQSMKVAFVPRHFAGVFLWYLTTWALTLVPLVYTCVLLHQQANQLGPNLYFANQSTTNQSELLASLETCDDDGNCSPHNPCNPNSIYCLSIQPGLLAGFGLFFAGATAFWAGWMAMDDTAQRILRNEDADEGHEALAYFSAVPERDFRQPHGPPPQISHMR